MLPAGFESLIQQHQSPYQASAYQQPGIGPFDGLPIPGGVLGEVGFQMLVAPQIQGMMATNGYIPGGFRGHQNLYDRQRAIAAQNQRQAVINNAAKMEQYHLRDTIGGVNRLFDMGMNESTIQASAANAAAMAPMMAQMAPGMLSQMGGRGGSPTLMAMRMLESPDRIDPVTGRSGMTTESMNELTSNLYRDMFLANDPFARKNVKAEDMGAIYAQLARSGMLAPPSGSRRQRGVEAYRDLARSAPEMAAKMRADVGLGEDSAEMDPAKFSDDQIDSMMKTKTLQRVIRSKDTAQVEQVLDSYKEMTSAMKDIFGANGETDAPMPKVWAALEALTGGMSSVGNKDAMAGRIRTIGELAKQSGVGLDELGMMNQQIGQKLANNALPAILQTKLLENRLADQRAYDMVGVGAGAGIGSMTKQEALNYQQDMLISGLQSSSARNLAAVLAQAENTPAEQQSSAVRALVAAVRGEKTEFSYLDANGKPVTRKTADFGNDGTAQLFMEREQGLSATQANIAMNSQLDIDRALANYNISGTTTANQAAEQREDVANRVARRTAEDVKSLAELTPEESLQTAVLFDQVRYASLSKAIEEDPAMAQKTPANQKKIEQLQLDALRAEINKAETPATQKIKAKQETQTEEQVAASLRKINQAQNQLADTTTKEDTGLNSEADRIALNTDRIKKAKRAATADAKRAGEVAASVSGISSGDVFGRLFEGLREVGGSAKNPDGTWNNEITKVISKGFGGIKREDISAAIVDQVMAAEATDRELQDVTKELEQLEENGPSSNDEAVLAQHEEKTKQLQAKKSELAAKLKDEQDLIRVFLPADDTAPTARATAADYTTSAEEFKKYGDSARKYKASNIDPTWRSMWLAGSSADDILKAMETPAGKAALNSARAENVAANTLLGGIKQDTALRSDLPEEAKDQLAKLTVAQSNYDSLAANYAAGDAGRLAMGVLRPYDKSVDREYADSAAYLKGVTAKVAEATKTRNELLPEVAKAAVSASTLAESDPNRLSQPDQNAVTNFGLSQNKIEDIEEKTGLKNTRLEPDVNGKLRAVADYTDKEGHKTAGIPLNSHGKTLLLAAGLTIPDGEIDQLGQAAFHRERQNKALRSIAERRNTDPEDLEKEVEALQDEGQETARATERQTELETAFKRQTFEVPATDADAEQIFGISFEQELKSSAAKTKAGLDQANRTKTVAAQKNVLATGEHYADPRKEFEDSKRTLADAENNAANLYAELGGDSLDKSAMARIAKEREISEADLKQFRADYETVKPVYELRTNQGQKHSDAMMIPDPMAAERSAGKETASNQATQAAQPQAVASTTTGNTAPMQVFGDISVNLENGLGRLNLSMPNSAT